MTPEQAMDQIKHAQDFLDLASQVIGRNEVRPPDGLSGPPDAGSEKVS